METADQTPALTVLVVDDDISLTLYLKNALVQDGHRVLLAVNEHGALEALKREPVDIVLCDYMLPGLNGLEIIRIIKERPNAPYCALITGFAGQVAEQHAAGHHADRIIAKPILKETLQEIVTEYRRSL